MKEHNIKLTSAELGSLWASYMAESAALPLLKYFNRIVKDLEIKSIVEYALDKSAEHLTTLSGVFSDEKFDTPIGFSDEDVDIKAPRLYSDTYMLYFLRNLGKNGISANGMALSMSARKDIKDLYNHFLNESVRIENETTEIMLSKGVYIRPPYMDSYHADIVENAGFLRGWFGERRPLTAAEITHIFLNFTNNSFGKALLTGFAQTAKSEELRNYFVRGIELSRTIMDSFHRILEECSLPSPESWDAGISESTTAPFSDKLMLFYTVELNAIGIGNIGGSLALSMRRDLSAKYIKMIKDIGLYAEDGANLLIKNNWFERPPQAIDREYLTKR
ncbi:DUF3231 family protein [Mesobacillus harenae]|uniref:DUF3231 family protein n=1 Tax=Mesobacillus harenae TaxID=2213203 RepID=UPI00158030A7|nr:DUF3231 family protein [Mesobacillus harenae]